ncbi:MAG: SDR family NAD(P)-dependent oxidoreductase [Candidatus Pacebacteria bacterium]|jgi:NAD(P)-dependent dehydrogenase (short-subunit alcohol dehydrogenase family)|nr:SDR family NAD(P)-dependent oxidoreductase [Candidatus Paceibacterota bacterium]
MRLENKVAVVTGSASGIGKAIAEMFITEGAKVVYSDISEIPGFVESENAAFCRTDVSDSTEADALIAFAVEKFGKLDILVNNAGIGPTAELTATSDEMWNKVLAVDLNGTFYCLRSAAKYMKDNRINGSIINMASIMGLVGFRMASAYCAAKGAVNQLTKVSSLELAPDGIRVNSIAPGVIETAMTKDSLENPDARAYILGSTPLGKLGEPNDIAYAAVYLASNESKFVTGSVLYVDGGWTAQ